MIAIAIVIVRMLYDCFKPRRRLRSAVLLLGVPCFRPPVFLPFAIYLSTFLVYFRRERLPPH